MASIVGFRLPADQFALADTLKTVPELHLESERFLAHGAESAMPFVWVTTADFDAFEQALATDSTVKRFSPMTEAGKERLYRIEWAMSVEHALSILLKKGGAITSARTNTSSQWWEIQLMCSKDETLSEIYTFCEENGLSFTIETIYELDGTAGSEHGLTKPQYESLLKANEMGYYSVPREITLSELAEELDLSHQALSERLRRGHGALIDRYLESTQTPEPEVSSDPSL